VVKTHPCAKLECWIDPESLPPPRALEKIGKNLQEQYETLSMRTRYKLQLDPSIEDARKFCQTMRRSAKDERVLFHYNGHGVPKPTSGGEIWVFNKNFTQYIPVPVYDFMGYLGTPCLYVWDCSAAGHIINAFRKFADQRDSEIMASENAPNPPRPKFTDCIHLAACRADEVLPMNPDLPADLFTSCLTTPIDMALRFFILQNPLLAKITIDQVKKIPGRTSDRKSPRGELYWIFTSVTDTIAWSVLPRPLFKKLFRQDLMVAALFRNFLLADRIMRNYNCHPISNPPLPPTHNHPMWEAWDLAVDQCLNQMPEIVEKAERLEKEKAERERYSTGEKEKQEPVELYQTGKRFSTFFEEQLTAFEVWLQTAAITKEPPDQLPIVLQVLLSQFHRLRALLLLTRFLDLGPWAVNLALSIGIFPYVCKLLLSPAADLKATLIFIWARILAVDKSCQVDLLKDNGYTYFVRLLQSTEEPMLDLHIHENCIPEHRSMCAFILAVFCKDFRQGQIACMAPGVMQICLRVLKDSRNPAEPLMRHWTALLISQLWNDFPEAKWQGIREGAPLRLVELLHDPIPEVRVAALVALTTLIGNSGDDDQSAQIEMVCAVHALSLNGDMSSVVRKELVIFLSKVVSRSSVPVLLLT
jgi:regulatory associated protein of mTOR